MDAPCCITTSISLRAQRRDWFRCRYCSGNCVIDGGATHVDADERRYPGLLHCHAVNGIRRFGGSSRVVRDDDELCVRLEFVEHPYEPPDVRVIERRVDFIQQTKRARLRQKYPEQKRQSYESPLATGQQVNSLCALSPWRRVNLDVTLERALRILQSEVAFATAEQCHEDLAEVLAHLD